MTWPQGWFGLDDPEDQTAFAEELAREVCVGHKLHGLKTRAIARCCANDDFIFEVEGGRWAFVHLTWAKETRPEWPDAAIFASLEDCIAKIDNRR